MPLKSAAVLLLRNNRFGWRLVDEGGNIVADSADDLHRIAQGAHTALERFRKKAPGAQIATRAVAPKKNEIVFDFERRRTQWAWIVRTAEGVIGRSVPSFPSKEEALASIGEVKAVIANLPIIIDPPPPPPLDVPLQFTVSPPIAEWGQELVLDAVTGTFGDQRNIELTYGNEKLSLPPTPPWGSKQVKVTLPAEPPEGFAEGVYDVNLVRPAALKSFPITIVPFTLPVFTFEVKTKPPEWGKSIELVTTLGTFGSGSGSNGAGFVNLVGVSRLDIEKWERSLIRVKLPAKPTPELYLYKIIVERGSGLPGQADLVFPLPKIDPTPILNGLMKGIRLEATKKEVLPTDPRLPLNVFGLENAKTTQLGNLVSVDIRWEITDENGKPVSREEALQTPALPGELTSRIGTVFALVPRFVRYGENKPLIRYVKLHVILVALGRKVPKTFTVGPITVASLPIPTVVGLFDEPNFAAKYALFATPKGPADLGAMRAALKTVRICLKALQMFGSLPNVIRIPDTLNQLKTFIAGIDAKAFFVVGMRIDNFKDYEYDGFFYTAEDTSSSVLFIGMPGDLVGLYAGRDTSGGFIAVSILNGHLVTAIPTLARMPIDSDPPNSVKASDSPQWFASNYDNVLSSLTFERGGGSPPDRTPIRAN